MDLLRSISKPVFAVADRLFPSPGGPRVLIYHQVGVGHGKQMEVTSEDFEWQLKWLVENRRVVDLKTALSQWNSPRSEEQVVLTFDDGYRDTYTKALPVLKAYGLPFSIYVATSFVAESDESHDLLTWGQLEEMAGTGLLTVGAHTHSHADLRTLEERSVEREIEVSNDLIEARLGMRPKHFAYPWGYWGETADGLIRAEYETAALGAPHRGVTSDLDPHLVHRFPVQLSDGRRWFKSRLEGGLIMEEELRRRLRGYRGP